jgi:hypothetical protein
MFALRWRQELVVRSVDFSEYAYIPSLLGDEVSRLAHAKLRPDTKAGILPILELCWEPGAADFSTSLGVVEAMGASHPFILEIDKRLPPEPYISAAPRKPAEDKRRYERELAAKLAFDAEFHRLTRATDGFFGWRELVSHFPNLVPMLQFTNVEAERKEVLRQADLLCVGGASAAFRITQMRTEEVCSLAAEILMRLEDPRQILLVIDCGQGRAQLRKRAAFVAEALQALQSQVGPSRAPLIRAVCMSNSFRVPDHKGTTFSDNLDWEVRRRVCTSASLAFGDYAGSSRPNAHPAYRVWDWVPTVTHTLPGGWLIHRHANKNDRAGWVSACKDIKGDPRFSSGGSWCDQIIGRVASDGASELDKPRYWHAARMNGHIERQYERSKGLRSKVA